LPKDSEIGFITYEKDGANEEVNLPEKMMQEDFEDD
jgi:hypothetical protein